ncbi:hypothetical protein [Streptomyces olivaceus]|uniref:hypothetical protein n=1 Tax=Streptomyces olivaceus TaxID=47716 RepID=UPI0035562D75
MGDAVVVGLGSMIGAGLFPAALYPASGGTYVYGRERARGVLRRCSVVSVMAS